MRLPDLFRPAPDYHADLEQLVAGLATVATALDEDADVAKALVRLEVLEAGMAAWKQEMTKLAQRIEKQAYRREKANEDEPGPTNGETVGVAPTPEMDINEKIRRGLTR